MYMKKSIYNYIVPNGSKTIFYNGLSEYFFEVPQSKAELYSEILDNPSEYYDSFPGFIERMIEKGFIHKKDVDESVLLDEKYRRVRSEDELHVMILPTYQCNLRCWYCVQEHRGMRMSDETVRDIKLFLKKKIQDSKIKRVRLSWFGGEPLLG